MPGYFSFSTVPVFWTSYTLTNIHVHSMAEIQKISCTANFKRHLKLYCLKSFQCLFLLLFALSWYYTDDKGKGKGFPYSIPSVGLAADLHVQAVSLQVTLSHPPGGRLPLLSTRPAATSPAPEHHCPLAGTKLYSWWQRHIGMNNLPKVVTQHCPE